MKRIPTLILLILPMIGYSQINAFFHSHAGIPPVTYPIAYTSAPTNITHNSASCGGDITYTGGVTLTAVGVCYSLSDGPTIFNTCISATAQLGSFTVSVTSLTANTIYHTRAYATNSSGYTSYGQEEDFATATTTGSLPIVTTTVRVSSFSEYSSIVTPYEWRCITAGTATSATTLNTNGVCWATHINPDLSDSKTYENNPSQGAFTAYPVHLTQNTEYWFRLYATNAYGTTYGVNQYVKTGGILFLDGHYGKSITNSKITWNNTKYSDDWVYDSIPENASTFEVSSKGLFLHYEIKRAAFSFYIPPTVNRDKIDEIEIIHTTPSAPSPIEMYLMAYKIPTYWLTLFTVPESSPGAEKIGLSDPNSGDFFINRNPLPDMRTVSLNANWATIMLIDGMCDGHDYSPFQAPYYWDNPTMAINRNIRLKIFYNQ